MKTIEQQAHDICQNIYDLQFDVNTLDFYLDMQKKQTKIELDEDKYFRLRDENIEYLDTHKMYVDSWQAKKVVLKKRRKELRTLNKNNKTSFVAPYNTSLTNEFLPRQFKRHFAEDIKYMPLNKLQDYGSAVISPDGAIYVGAATPFIHSHSLNPAAKSDGWEVNQLIKLSRWKWELCAKNPTMEQLMTVIEYHNRLGKDEIVMEFGDSQKVLPLLDAIKTGSETKGVGMDFDDMLEGIGVFGDDFLKFGAKYNKLTEAKERGLSVPRFIALSYDECEAIYEHGLYGSDPKCLSAQRKIGKSKKMVGNNLVMLRTSPFRPMSGLLDSWVIDTQKVCLEDEVVRIIKENKDRNTFPKEWGFGFGLGIQVYKEANTTGVIYNHDPFTGKIGLFGEYVFGDGTEFNMGTKEERFDVNTCDYVDWISKTLKDYRQAPTVYEYITTEDGIIVTQIKDAYIQPRAKANYYNELYQQGKITKSLLDHVVPNIEVSTFVTDKIPSFKGILLSGNDVITLDASEILMRDVVSPSDLEGYRAVICTNPTVYNHTADLCREKGIMAIALKELPVIDGEVTMAPDGNIYHNFNM